MSDQDKSNVTSITDASKPNPFTPGDVVVLKSGSNPMVIAAGKPTDTRVKCMFVGHHDVETKELPVVVLETQLQNIERSKKLHAAACPNCSDKNKPQLLKEGVIEAGPDGKASIMVLGENGMEPAPPELTELLQGILGGGVGVDFGDTPDDTAS